MEIENCRITNVSISMADYCSLVFWVTVEGSGWGCSLGGFKIASGMLGAKTEDFKAETGNGLVAIMRIMDTVGVERWEDLVGKYCRVKADGLGSRITCIGNIIRDKWFDVGEFFKNYKDTIKPNVKGSKWKPLEGEGVYECKHCGNLVDIVSQYCPECGSFMTNFNEEEG